MIMGRRDMGVERTCAHQSEIGEATGLDKRGDTQHPPGLLVGMHGKVVMGEVGGAVDVFADLERRQSMQPREGAGVENLRGNGHRDDGGIAGRGFGRGEYAEDLGPSHA